MERKIVKINFYDDYATFGREVVSKEEAMEIIDYERSNGNVKGAKITSTESSETYIFYINDYELHVRLPYRYLRFNEKSAKKVNKLYQIERKKLKARLKLITLALTTGVVSGVVFSEPIKDFCSEIGNYFEILELDEEIKDHTGYTYLDGAGKLSEKDHMKNGCSLGDYIYDIDKQIEIYCQEKGLGEEVAEAAIEKYHVMDEDGLQEAKKISLFSAYKNRK